MIIKWNWEDGYIRNRPEPDPIEIDDTELEGMTEDDKQDYINDVVTEAFFNQVSYGWSIVDEGKGKKKKGSK